MKRTLKNLISHVSINDWKNDFFSRYPEKSKFREDYLKANIQMRDLAPIEADIRYGILVEKSKPSWELNTEFTVSGHNLDTGERFALDYLPWNELLYYEVISDLSDIHTLSEIMYEVTFYGTTMEEIEKRKERLMSSKYL